MDNDHPQEPTRSSFEDRYHDQMHQKRIGILVVGILLTISVVVLILSNPSPSPIHRSKRSDPDDRSNCHWDDEHVTILRSNSSPSNKIEIVCPIVILGAGIAGAHSAYRLSSKYPNRICVFDRNAYVGGRTYDVDVKGDSPPAYAETPVAPVGAYRFYEGQAVVKQLANELNISSTEYEYQTLLIQTRGRSLTSTNEICSQLYRNLNCSDDANGLKPEEQLWQRLIEVYQSNPMDLYRFGDFSAFVRATLGDEATSFLRDTERTTSYFNHQNAQSFMERYVINSVLHGVVQHPTHGMSQFAKRMMHQATTHSGVQLYLNEEVLKIDEACSSFVIETSRYIIHGRQLIAAMEPLGWTNITGSIANEIKSHPYFQAILPIKTVTIQMYWPRRWWEESAQYGSTVDRVWARQNCLVDMEIVSRRPEERSQNLTRAYLDDGQCVEFWSNLVRRPSNSDLIDEILRNLRSLFTDVKIPIPTRVFSYIWPSTVHAQKANSRVTNAELARWSLHPLTRLDRRQLTLIGEAFFLNRARWIEASLKSSLIALTSQFDLPFDCFENDVPSGGRFCPSEYLLE